MVKTRTVSAENEKRRKRRHGDGRRRRHCGMAASGMNGVAGALYIQLV